MSHCARAAVRICVYMCAAGGAAGTDVRYDNARRTWRMRCYSEVGVRTGAHGVARQRIERNGVHAVPFVIQCLQVRITLKSYVCTVP